MGRRLDRLTDYAAVGFSLVVAVTLWGLFLYQYLRIDPVGSVPTWLMSLAALFTLLAALTLFGAEKVRQAIELRTGGGDG